MFEKATRLKLRFNSSKGSLAVEDLWDLPLTSITGKANLEDIAKELHASLKNDEVSFVSKASKKDEVQQLRFDIVLHVINVRVAENEAAKTARETAEKKQKIREIINRRQDEQLETMDVSALQQMLDSL